MIADLERYRFAPDSVAGIATVAVLCATCHEADQNTPAVVVFDFQFPSVGDVHAVIERHEAGRHGGGA
jgi:hypothetical protein